MGGRGGRVAGEVEEKGGGDGRKRKRKKKEERGRREWKDAGVVEKGGGKGWWL